MVKALLNRILVRSREGSEDKVSAVWVAFRYAQLIAIFNSATYLIDIGEIDMRIYAMAKEIESKGNEADIAGSFTISKERSFDAISAR